MLKDRKVISQRPFVLAAGCRGRGCDVQSEPNVILMSRLCTYRPGVRLAVRLSTPCSGLERHLGNRRCWRHVPKRPGRCLDVGLYIYTTM